MAEALLEAVDKAAGIDRDKMEAIDLLAQGKRNLLCGEVPKAVNELQEACRRLASKFGETADECAEAYFYYGKALLELSRIESGVLGNALQGIEEDEADEKSDEKAADVVEKDDLTEGETSQEEGGESEDIGDEESEEQEGTGEETEGDAEGETKEGEGTSEKKEEEDVSNLQLAWEMLELSKIIFKRNNTKEAKLKLADSFLNLGEVGMETEQYETAISDFKECLRLQMELLDADDRAIAETYYQLGLACTFHALYDEAVDYYRKASSTIETRIANLKKIIEGMEGKGKEKADPDDPLVKAQKEVKDLEDIIPDIMAKIEDVLDEKRNADQVKQLVKDNLTSSLEQTSTTTTGFGQTEKDASQAGAVKDITHLVRKRKKVEDEDEDAQKKAKTQENGTTDQVNGTAELNGKASVNGQASKSEVSAS